MRSFGQFLAVPLLVSLVLTYGCAMVSEDAPRKGPPVGLIATPPSYYSTLKAKYLGQKYQGNLSRLVEKIVRNPKTANLQFANNIASVGGIGFFTHSAAKVPDERYLEVVLVAPETFEKKGDYSAKVNRLFSLYGLELLTILSSDDDIFREPEVAGYGLNLSWRTITSEASAPSVTMERAVAYFPKEEVRRFLNKGIVENAFLRDAVIFAAEADGPMSLVSYRPQQRNPDFRPPIQEEVLAAEQKPQDESKPTVRAPQAEAISEAVSRVESPAVQSPMGKQEATPEKSAIDQPVVPEKARTFVGETSQRTEALSGPPSQPVEKPKQKTAAASPQVSLSKNEPEVTKTRDESPPQAKTESTSPGPEKTKQTEETKPSEALSKKAETPKPVADARDVETRQSSMVATERFAAKASSSVTQSAVAARTPAPEAKKSAEALSQKAQTPEPAADAPLQERVAAPVALSKPGLKTTAEASHPTVIASPKSIPSVSPSVKTNHQAKAGERQAPALESAKREVSMTSAKDRVQAKVEESPAPTSSVGPDRTASVASKQEVEIPKLPETIEAGIPPPPSVKTIPVKPIAETQVAKKKATETPAPVVKVKKSIVTRNIPSPSAPVAPPAKPAVAKPVKEELALLTNRPTNKLLEDQPRFQAAPKTLKGYIIQIAFNDKDVAQQWAERLERRGYAVSVTQAGGSGSLRVRIGNFPERREAERELQALGKDGLRGIVLNLPDGFRPAGQISKGDGPVKAAPAAQ